MTDVAVAPSVALLFSDAGLGAHLRDALTALGARIVHEGPPADVTGEALAASGADVVVVNLEPTEEAYLERLYEALDGGSCQVIFNDAEASRNLSGWDRARWARHLAAKLVGSPDVDPPRPADARTVQSSMEARSANVAQVRGDAGDGDVAGRSDAHGGEATMRVAADENDDAQDAIESRQMAAELAGMLAGDNAGADGMPGDIADGALDAAPDAAPADAPAETARESSADVAEPKVAVEERQTIGDSSSVADWELVDFNAAPPAATQPQEDARDFGVEKMRAEDFLAPDTVVSDSPVEPGIELELVSLEESIAPTMYDEPVSEMLLGEGMGNIRRVVVVGAGADGTAATSAFFAGLPASLPALVLLVHHQQDQSLEELVAALEGATGMPVRAAHDGATARHGEVWLVPAGQTCRLRRDGVIKLGAVGTTVLGDPSIDECLSAIADAFGTDVTAIVLAGSGYDALAGAQDVHDRGGRVWVQDPATCGDDGMATAIQSEGLATFTGAPEDLARHLVEACA